MRQVTEWLIGPFGVCKTFETSRLEKAQIIMLPHPNFLKNFDDLHVFCIVLVSMERELKAVVLLAFGSGTSRQF